MSTKGTIFLTKDNEHCYDETFEKDNGIFRVYLEINQENIKFIQWDSEAMVLGIKGDSDIAKKLRKARE